MDPQSMNHQHFDVRENYCASTQRAAVDDLNKMQTPCEKCTSIYMVLRDRSPFDRAALRTYNRLPAQYNTRLDTLVFAP
jgi:hypothetical protein